ncbi:MAG TPA: hypothetical protein VGH93_08905 [Solirubrobacteraceae bacterium]
MNRIVRHLRGNAVAYLALFVALGGTSYAAFSVPANSVGTNQLRNHSVTPAKLDPKTIGASVRAWAVIQNGTKVLASRPKARVVSWDPTFAAGTVSWGSAVSTSCFPLSSGGRDFIQVALLPRGRGAAVVHYQAYTSSGQFDQAPATIFIGVFCPQR